MADNKITDKKDEPGLPNPALQPFGVLVGAWKTIGTHGSLPNIVLHGRTTFEWFENGAFLMMRSEIDDARFPSGVAIFGSDNVAGEYFQLYFDERGVSRKYDVSLADNILKWQRNGTDFSQRNTLTITDDGWTIIGKGELSKDGLVWEQDLDLTYNRIE